VTEQQAVRAAVIVCPRCGSDAVAEILYGLPAFSPELEMELDAGRLVLGGCTVWDGRADLSCTACGLEFWADGRPAAPPA
jgi:hypothetical protein